MLNNFNAVAWISHNYANVYIDEASQTAIVNFSLMWNVFEGQFCNNSVSVAKLDSIAEEVANGNFPAPAIEQIFNFYRNRFIEDGTTNWRFDSLNFRANDRKEFVREVVLNRNRDTKDVILASLIIVYRIRNNLFHGIKAFNLLHDQAENLNSASAFLSLVMECLRDRRNIEY